MRKQTFQMNLKYFICVPMCAEFILVHLFRLPKVRHVLNLLGHNPFIKVIEFNVIYFTNGTYCYRQPSRTLHNSIKAMFVI